VIGHRIAHDAAEAMSITVARYSRRCVGRLDYEHGTEQTTAMLPLPGNGSIEIGRPPGERRWIHYDGRLAP
jgi:hypothetical protein